MHTFGPDAEETPILTVRNVSKGFGKKRVLSNLFFTIKKGEIFGIVGQSGAGKTTLLQLLVGFIAPDTGEVLFRPEHLLLKKEQITTEFKNVLKERNEVARMFGFATQHPSFYDRLTVEENLKYFARLYNISPNIMQTNITTALELVGLADERNTLGGSLSGGMEKRLDIACALVHDPRVLILDEPTADLDIVLRRQMWHLIKRINSKGTTIIIASHFLQEMETLCHRVAILHDKKIKAIGGVDELKDLFSKSDEITIRAAPGNYAQIAHALRKEKLNIERMGTRENSMVIYSKESEYVLHHLIHILDKLGESLIDVEVKRPSLDEIFESIVKHGVEYNHEEEKI